MPPVNHALLSLSGSARWLACGPSARLEQQYPESSSVFAEEGTAAHERGEWKIRKYLHERMKEPRSDFDSEEMEYYTDQYAQFVIDAVEEMKKNCPVPMVLVETRLDLTKYVPESFGTADMILMGDGRLHIMDLKYGKGVSVSADHNSQLMLYALGALEAYGFLYDITDVSMTIIQPRLENFDTFSIKADELRRWGEEYVRPRAIRAFKGEGELVSGPHCRFCKHRPHCTKCAEDALRSRQSCHFWDVSASGSMTCFPLSQRKPSSTGYTGTGTRWWRGAPSGSLWMRKRWKLLLWRQATTTSINKAS